MGKNFNKKKITWIPKFPIDSLQIYFACSLEIQDELIRKGFKVPKDSKGKIKTPIPIIYANFKGWLNIKNREPITIERVIPPEWYGKTPEDFGWEERKHKGKRAFIIPEEEAYLHIGVKDSNSVIFLLEPVKYHLERPSIRTINPEKWTNWAMFYIDLNLLDKIIQLLKDYLPEEVKVNTFPLEKEILQGGKEKTKFARKTNLGIPVIDFGLCLGCFDEAIEYLRHKAIENGLPQNIVRDLKLRIVYDENVNTGLKVGIANIVGKRLQLMFKLASDSPITIDGILKPKIEGKARGKLVYCDHEKKNLFIIVNISDLYSALESLRQNLKQEIPTQKIL